MASIIAKELSVFYPMNGSSGTQITGMPTPENMVSVNNRMYIRALNNISFSFQEGDRIGLIGRNGSGKSTLLRVLGGIYAPTSGTLETSGKISSLFNINLGVQVDRSGRDNILTRGLIKGWSRTKIRENMDDIIDFSGIRDFIDLPLRTYSDGMRMRLLFAIATSFSPEILLLDEWIGAGDSDFREKAAQRMNSLVSEAGITVIASHNRSLLRRVCDIGLWIENGRIVAFGNIDDVYEQLDKTA